MIEGGVNQLAQMEGEGESSFAQLTFPLVHR